MTISSWLNFGYPMPPGRGSAVGQKLLAPPYYSQRTVFASPPSTLFIISWTFLFFSCTVHDGCRLTVGTCKYPKFSFVNIRSSFLPHDTMCRCSTSCRMLSICLSVTLMCCIQMLKDIIRLLSLPDSHIILVVFNPSIVTQFQGELPQWGH